jgi:5-methylcytosine-specific restriction endonuclease McrA
VRLAPLIRPLVELHWTRMVATLNRVATEEQDLHRHLFGRDRLVAPKALREGLASLQARCCFYCGMPFHRAPEADHFIPRVRCGIDAVENLVLADRSCNNDKRDLLPAPPLVDAWAGRNREHQGTLASLASLCGWDSDPRAPWRSPALSIVTCRRALRRSGAAPGLWTSRTPAPASSSRSFE